MNEPSESAVYLMGAVYGLTDYAAKAPDEISRQAIKLAANILQVAADTMGIGPVEEESEDAGNV